MVVTTLEKILDNTPAFPTTEANGCNYGAPGMDLRDYFAAKAMQTLLTADLSLIYPEWIMHNSKGQVSVGLTAYAMADAMMESRK